MLDVFPNPAAGQTRISMRLHQTRHVRIHVFDVLGRRVEVIYEGTLAGGNHTFAWNAEMRAAGALFLRAEVGSQSIVRSLLRP